MQHKPVINILMKICSSSKESGSALLAVLLISLFVVVGLMVFARRIQSYTREDVSRLGRQKAFELADSGVYSVVNWLRSPGNSTALPPGSWLNPGDPNDPGQNILSDFTSGNGGYQVSVYRSNIDSSLVDAYSTGYYYINAGAYITPPSTPRPDVKAQR